MEEISPEYHNNPFFISGNVFPTSSLDIILCHVLSNKFILQILQLLVTGCDQSLNCVTSASSSSSKVETAALTSIHCFTLQQTIRVNDLQMLLQGSCQLFQMPIPTGFEEKTYGDMMEYLLLEKDILCIGLFRRMDDRYEHQSNDENSSSGSGNSTIPSNSEPMIRERYVQTNPRPSERLSSSDYVFILSSSFPSSFYLIGGGVSLRSSN